MDESLNLEKITKEYVKFGLADMMFVLPCNLIEPLTEYLCFVSKYWDYLKHHRSGVVLSEDGENVSVDINTYDVCIGSSPMPTRMWVSISNADDRNDQLQDFLSILESISCHSKDAG